MEEIQISFQTKILIKNVQNIVIFKVKIKILENCNIFLYIFYFINFCSSGTMKFNRHKISENVCFWQTFKFIKRNLTSSNIIVKNLKQKNQNTKDKNRNKNLVQ